MSSSVALYSSHSITTEELAEVIQQAGGVVTPDGPYFGRVSHDWSHVWINILPCYDGVFDKYGKAFHKEELELLDQAKKLLGGEFQTWLSIILSHSPDAQRLAVHFAYTCCQRWTCIVDNLRGQLFTREEIERLHREGGGFTTYGL